MYLTPDKINYYYFYYPTSRDVWGVQSFELKAKNDQQNLWHLASSDVSNFINEIKYSNNHNTFCGFFLPSIVITRGSLTCRALWVSLYAGFATPHVMDWDV